jgi:hypothetical protein
MVSTRLTVTALALAVLFLSGTAVLGMGSFLVQPAYAAPFADLDIAATSSVEGEEAIYVITFEAATGAYVKTVEVDFADDFDASGAFFGGSAVLRETGTMSVSAGEVVEWEMPTSQRFAAGRSGTLIIAGVINPAGAGAYDITVRTLTSGGSEIDATTAAFDIAAFPALGVGTITGAMILDGTITADDIAAGAVDSSEIATGAVKAADIDTDAVGSAEIAADAVGSSEIAADAVGSAEIAADAVGTSEIADGSVTSADIAADTITAADIAADAVGSSEIAADAVGAAEIAAGAVGTSEIADGTVASADIAADTIVAADIADDAVGAAEIAADAVGSAEIAADAVGSSEIAAGAVTNSELDLSGGLDLDGGALSDSSGGDPDVDIADDVTVAGALTTTGDISIGGDDLTLDGAAATIAMAAGASTLTLGDSGDTITIPGALTLTDADGSDITIDSDFMDLALTGTQTFVLGEAGDTISVPGDLNIGGDLSFLNLDVSEDSFIGNADSDVAQVFGTLQFTDSDTGDEEARMNWNDNVFNFEVETATAADFETLISVSLLGANTRTLSLGAVDGDDTVNVFGATIVLDGDAGTDEFTLTDTTLTVTSLTTIDVDATGDITVDTTGAGSSIQVATGTDGIAFGSGLAAVEPADGEFGVDTVGVVDINAGTDVTIDTAGTDDEILLTTDTGGISLRVGGATVDPADGELDITASGIIDVNSEGGDITVDTTGASNSIQAATGTDGIAFGSGLAAVEPADGEFGVDTVGVVDINAGTDVTIDTAGSGDEVLVTTDTGGISLRVGGATVDPDDGELDVTTSGTVDVNAGTSVTLDAATDISVTAAATADSDILAAALTGGVAIGAGNAAADPGDGEVDITNTAAVDINAGTDVTIDTAGTDDEILLTTGTGGISLRVGGATVDPADGELDITASGIIDVNSEGGDITVDTTGASNSIQAATGTDGIAFGSGLAAVEPADGEFGVDTVGVVDINAGTDVTIDTAGSGDEVLVTTDTGGISLRVGGATVDPDDGELDVTTSGTVDVNAGTSVTLDAATDISVTAAATADSDILAAALTGGVAIGAGNAAADPGDGEVDITNTAAVDINAGTDVTIDTAGTGDEILLTTDTGGISLRVGGATVDPADGELDVTTSGTVDVNAGTTLTIDTTAGTITLTSGGAGNDIELLPADVVVIGSVANGLSITTAGVISDANAAVEIGDTFKLGTDGSTLTDITVNQLADGTSGWTPDAATATFTITATAAAITTDAIITISLDGGDVAAGSCFVSDVNAGTNFVIRCGANIPDGATLNYMIVDP